jgi:predicted SAM-dependent methyltransferase
MDLLDFPKHFYRAIRKRYRIQKKRLSTVRQIKNTFGELRIIFGAGPTHYEGWISTDFPYFDITSEKDWSCFFKSKKPTNILAEHVIDYLTVEKIEFVLQQANKYLEKNGRFRIAVLDSYNENLDYIDAVKPSGWDSCRGFHKTFLDVDFFIRKANETGLKIELLEYYTKDRKFHSIDFSDEDGYVIRSKKHNFTFPNIPNYTSLIIDLIKE